MELNQPIKAIIDFFNGNPGYNVVTFLLAIVALVFSFYFYFKSKKSKIPTYSLRTINLVKEKIQKIDTVEILYSGEKVKNLSISKIAFWNDGRETINSHDIAQNNPIRIEIENSFQILDAEILFQKNISNDFKIKISEDNKSVLISFDYFDLDEGIVLQIFHTGNESESIKMSGQIKSVKSIKRRGNVVTLLPSFLYNMQTTNKKLVNISTRRNVIGWVVFTMGVIFCFSSVIFVNVHVPTEAKNFDPFKSFSYVNIILGVIYMGAGYKVLKRRIPKGFNIFNEEF